MPVVVISSDVTLGPPRFPPDDARPVVSIIEFDVPRCMLTYGLAPCTAELGVTGSAKCYNVRGTCQDLENFTPETFTFRFTRGSAQIHRDQGNDVVPNVRVVRTTPQLLEPGVSLGQRESVQITFEDHQHSDAGIDPYVAERGFDPFAQGTFWGKLRARLPSLRGLPLRVYRGRLGDELEAMDVWHYVIETASLVGDDFVITGKDHLKFLDGDRAQAPAASLGELDADIVAGAGSATLAPAGIGNLNYPASGKVAIGGSEIASFTRVGDVLTLTARGMHGSEDQDHDEGERVQIVLEFTAEAVEDVIYALLIGYTEIDPTWINLAAWHDEVGAYVDQLYTGVIAEPTDVRDLVNELIEQAGLVCWWDLQRMLVHLIALRPVVSNALLVGAETMIAGTYAATEQPRKRVSEVWTYFNLRNPLEPIDEESNYASIVVTPDPDADPDDLPAIRKVFSRWIGFGNRGAATRLNAQLLSRYATPPRLFRFELYRDTALPELGRGAQITHRSLQDAQGAGVVRPVQIVSMETDDDRTRIQAEEFNFAASDALGRLIVIDSDALNVNLRELHDSFYAEPVGYEAVECIIDTAATVGSAGPGLPSFDVGIWPPAVSITLTIRGTIQGAGGAGGAGKRGDPYSPAQAGGTGGAALYTRYPLIVDSSGSITAGLGGGGGGSSGDALGNGQPGGGGAGTLGGVVTGLNPGPVPSTPGRPDAGGQAGLDSTGTYKAGNGGDPMSSPESGQPQPPMFPGPGGVDDFGGAAGDPGPAVDGDSFIAYTNLGAIVGARIN